MHDIFLSYASEDRPRAGQLADALGKLGWRVWWDRTILPGKTFDRVIESELIASTCVIVLWSKTSVESQWVRAEAGEALKQNRLIPALLEDVKIPLVFRQIQAAALLDWEGSLEHPGFTQLTRAITAFVAPSEASETHPDTGETEKKPEATEPEQPGHQPGERGESRQVSGQSKSGRQFTSLFWPAATVGALSVASLSIYLNWQKPTVTEVPVTAEIAIDPIIQDKRSDQGDAILNTARPAAVPREAKAKPVIKKDSHLPPAVQARAEPPAPDPVPRVTPPKSLTAKPAQASPRVVNTRPVVSPADTPMTTLATTTPSQADVPRPPPAPVRVLMIAWGTPSDEGLASPIPTRDYSGNLAQLMSGVVKNAIRRPMEFEYRYITDRDHHSLMSDKPEYEESSALCSETSVDLVIAGFVEGSEFDEGMGYLPTRRPFFSVYHCKSGKGAAKRFEVGGTLGDSFPYEKALTNVFRSFSQQELPAVGSL